MIWLRIAGRPARQFYADDTALPYLADEARHCLLDSAGSIRSGVEGETPNISVTLRNAYGECVDLFRIPPLGAAAEVIHHADGVLFAGIVQSVDMGEECTVAVQS